MHNLNAIKTKIKQLAIEYGFQQANITDLNTSDYFPKFKDWVTKGNHGSMSFLERNQSLRQFPASLHPNTQRIISLRYDYLPDKIDFINQLEDSDKAYISRYALGRDYHKLMRKKLKALAEQIKQECSDLDYRVFVDSAPVLETCFAEKSGVGWKGKHTLIINKQAGSWFFLGEIFINLPLEVDLPVDNLCNECTSCLKICPTQAIVAPYKVDARKCISYLTIENNGEIPINLRRQMGNRIYGCDDCQLCCPWNRFASPSEDTDFSPRHDLDRESLLNLFSWSEEEFNNKLQGNPIRRIGFEKWQRNIAVALGNSDYHKETVNALKNAKQNASILVLKHIEWAIDELENKQQLPSLPSQQKTKLLRTVRKIMPN